MTPSELSKRLAEEAERAAEHLFPNGRREGQEWRVASVNGDKGKSLGIHLSGNKAGIWSDFATGESGDLLDGKTAELESLSDDALIEMINSKGMDDLVVLDADGNLANRDELIQALMDDAAAMLAIIENFKNSSDSFILYFDYDDTEIDEVSTRKIIEHANFMQDNPSLSLRLEGHADERGTREYNLALGENRALSVKEVLSLYNLDDRILVVSYGEESPILVGSNEMAWEENRRVEFSYY